MVSFTDNKLLYEGRTSLLSEEDIKRQLGIDCDEMRSFIQLYLTYDGVSFPMQAMMFRHLLPYCKR